MNLKKTLAALLLSVAAGVVFAYDGTVVGGKDGEFSRKEFIEAAADMDQIYSVVETFAQGAEILRFYNVNEDNMDEEDVSFFNDVTAYIKDKYTVKNRDGYSHIVVRGETQDGTDGWLILSHYSASASDKWFHYIYYFEIAD